MNFLKKNYKLIIGIVIGAILISGISVYATGQYLASQVDYTTSKNGNIKNVEQALNDLYTKINNSNVIVSANRTFSSGDMTPTKFNFTINDNSFFTQSNGILTTSKSAKYIIFMSVGDNTNCEGYHSYSSFFELYVNNKKVKDFHVGAACYDVQYYVVDLNLGDTLYAVSYGDGGNYAKKATINIINS